jgi:hypothetical protein
LAHKKALPTISVQTLLEPGMEISAGPMSDLPIPGRASMETVYQSKSAIKGSAIH